MFETAICGGTAVTASSTMDVDIGIRDGKIVALEEPGSIDEAQKVIDADGRYVFPGFIDAHVHVNTSLGEFESTDGFSEVTGAAAHGGTTTIFDFAMPDPGESVLEAHDRKLDSAQGDAHVNYGFHGCITDVTEQNLSEIPDVIEAGSSTIKMFMTYEGRLRLTHGEIRDVMEIISEQTDGLALIHAEDQEMISREVETHLASDKGGYQYHPETHPNVSETAAMWVITNLVEEQGCPAYFVHVSTANSREVLEYVREQQLPVFSETCPHYLSLTSEVYSKENGENWVCSPPIRDEASTEALWELIDDGLIQTVNSDHCGYDTEQKRAFRDDMTRIPNGLPGVETRNTVLYSEGVPDGRISVSDFVALSSTNVAKMFGLYPQKGTIAIGTDADLVVYDPDRSWTVCERELHMETDYSPFDGFEIDGRPTDVLVDGEHVVRDNELIGDGTVGQFVPTNAGYEDAAL